MESKRGTFHVSRTESDRRTATDGSQIFFLSLRYFLPLDTPVPDLLHLNLTDTLSGSAAYACQCSWRNATALVNLELGPEMRWFCSGHTD
jgi:hypothetical protein